MRDAIIMRSLIEILQGEMIVNFLLHILENEESEKVQALLCIGIAKLLLAGMISDERVGTASE